MVSGDEDDVEVVVTDEERIRRRKVKIRAGHRAHVTKMYAAIENNIKNYDASLEVDMIAFRDTLKRKAVIISKLDEEILETLDDDEKIIDEVDNSEGIQADIQFRIVKIENLLQKQKTDVEEKKNVTKSDVKNEEKSVDVTKKIQAMVKLPKIEIQCFMGDPKEYRAFRDAFDVTIGDKDGLSDVEKFTYLRSYVKGDAENSIKGLPVTSANYAEAKSILEQRYGNVQIIVNSHMEELIKLPQVVTDKQTKKIRQLYDQIETNLRSLRSLGVKPESYGCLLVPILISKLPPTLNLHLSRKFDSSTDVWQVKNIMEELRKELEARERCGDTEKDKPDIPKKKPATLESLHSKHSVLTCPFCDKSHYPDQCLTVTDVVKRKELLMKKRLCLRCTKGGHVIKNCQSNRKCYRCKGNHHTSICLGKSNDDEDKESPVVEQLSAMSPNNTILLQTAQLTVGNCSTGGKKMNCKVIFDSGSQRTHITKRVARMINAPVHREEMLQINGVGGIRTKPKNYDVIEFELTKTNFDCRSKMQGIVVEKICTPLQGRYVIGRVESFAHLKNLPLADDDIELKTQEVEILVGLDYYYDVICGDVIRGDKGPVAVKSMFGYILSGSLTQVNNVEAKMMTSLRIEHISNEELFNEVKKFWEIEAIGIKDDDTGDDFEINIEKRADRYYVNLPWKPGHPILYDNYEVARKRLLSTCRRLHEQSLLKDAYCEVMTYQEDKEMIEDIIDGSAEPGKTYYMPHHPVVRMEKETSKVRVVYDASSKVSEGVSLNQCLVAGDTKFTKLFESLIKFRCHKIGIIADIEKAFLSVGIKDEDRDALRFLWVTNPDDMENPQIRRMRFTRVSYGVICSMAQLDGVIFHHLQKCEERYEDTVNRIRESLYIDDVPAGADNDDDGRVFYKEAKEVFLEAGMNLRKWKTNSDLLQREIDRCEDVDVRPKQILVEERLPMNPDESATTKVLGIPWDTTADELSFTVEAIKKYPPGRITKRILLAATASIFDPLGILAPIVVTFKMLFRKVCQNNKDWDEVLHPDQQEIWDKLLRDAKDYSGVKLRRCYSIVRERSITLVGFGDASKHAYAACVYIVVHGEDETVTSTLVTSKTRVAPLKETTLPRLELMAAYILSKLMKKTKESLQKFIPVSKIVCLTDAEIVLQWIKRTDREYKQFVQNRCRQIRENVHVDAWYHVPGTQNAADLPSRGCFPKQMKDEKTQSLWLHGPGWLKENEDDWPITNNVKAKMEELELKKEREEICLVSTNEKVKPSLQMMIEFSRFNDAEKLIRVVAWCRRFICNARKKKEERCKHREVN